LLLEVTPDHFRQKVSLTPREPTIPESL
jgi:hypothetical protein